jgi:hypothetical protein
LPKHPSVSQLTLRPDSVLSKCRRSRHPIPTQIATAPLYFGSGPVYGRTYAVFHNQERLGEIEIKPDWKYTTQDPRVTAYIELDWVRLLPFVTVRSFLVDIATHVSEYRPGTVDYVQANQEIDRAMTSVLWKTLKAPQYSFEDEPSYDAQIEVELTGSASYYLERRQYVRDQAAKA